jgi:hypothetical protein
MTSWYSLCQRPDWPLLSDAVDIGSAVAHQSVAVAAQVGNADIVAPDDDDIRLAALDLAISISFHWSGGFESADRSQLLGLAGYARRSSTAPDYCRAIAMRIASSGETR